jgi:hypothetical protein
MIESYFPNFNLPHDLVPIMLLYLYSLQVYIRVTGFLIDIHEIFVLFQRN